MNHDASGPSRRTLLTGAAMGMASLSLGGVSPLIVDHVSSGGGFVDLLRVPDLVRAFGPDGEIPLTKSGDGWSGGDVEIQFAVKGDHVAMTLRSSGEVTRLQARWHGDLSSVQRYLGDHWERTYADMEWRSEAPSRVLPWYFLANLGKRTDGYGVRTGPNAFVFWNADAEGVSLWADVRSGGSPVRLNGRTLAVCDVVCRRGRDGESAWAAAHAFCAQMCPNPRSTKTPIYGTNDWNFAYGKNSTDLILKTSSLVAELSPSGENRPYSVIDDGWSQGGLGRGPWMGNERFGDMGTVAAKMRDVGVIPGLWFRPLTTIPGQPDSWKLARDQDYLDPTVPEALDVVRENVERIVGWGYRMIKHDFTSYDITGRWGASMGPSVTADGWHFQDRSRTTAEVVKALYDTIRKAAGDVLIIGCNTFSHLSAGVFEIQRTGDDTSGRSWNRTRRMGVNTLAFRSPQQGTFYQVDPDIAAITTDLPWNLAENWLDLVAHSGTSLFVSPEPQAMGAPQREALKRALAAAAQSQPVGEPLDWTTTQNPRRWRFGKREKTYTWEPPEGANPYGD